AARAPRAAPDSERRTALAGGGADDPDRGPGGGSGRSEVTGTILDYRPDSSRTPSRVRSPTGQGDPPFVMMHV
ncbi:MAG: hypothetical protein JWN97_2056, partial [Nocardioides sp.]|nr:hypothetical protein [Nocardioides sp.]